MSDDCANPDRLAGEEIPAEIIKLVEEKFQEIQSAYEVVTKSRKSPRCPAIIPPMSTCATATVFKSRYTDGILHRPHRMEDTTMRMKKTIQLTLAALLGLSGALPAVATEYQASDYLPLAVGNSWTYDHEYYDIERRFGDRSQWSAYLAQAPFTIEVLRTEELDGQTYYVISEMPSNWPPPPPHFIAGKKLRWSGTHLMEHRGSGEQAIFRFDGHGTSYDIPTVEGDNRVTVVAGPNPVPWYSFRFHDNEGSRACNFLAGYGSIGCGWRISGEDHPLFINQVAPLHAVLGGTQVDASDAWIPTSTSSSTWGAVKRSLLARRTGMGNLRAGSSGSDR